MYFYLFGICKYLSSAQQQTMFLIFFIAAGFDALCVYVNHRDMRVMRVTPNNSQRL